MCVQGDDSAGYYGREMAKAQKIARDAVAEPELDKDALEYAVRLASPGPFAPDPTVRRNVESSIRAYLRYFTPKLPFVPGWYPVKCFAGSIVEIRKYEDADMFQFTLDCGHTIGKRLPDPEF